MGTLWMLLLGVVFLVMGVAPVEGWAGIGGFVISITVELVLWFNRGQVSNPVAMQISLATMALSMLAIVLLTNQGALRPVPPHPDEPVQPFIPYFTLLIFPAVMLFVYLMQRSGLKPPDG